MLISDSSLAQSVRIVLVTCPTLGEAKTIATALVAEHLAACVNILPTVTSVYFWQDAVQEDSECMLVIKTTVERLQALEAKVLAMHSYTVPECIAFPVTAGSQSYLTWLCDAVGQVSNH